MPATWAFCWHITSFWKQPLNYRLIMKYWLFLEKLLWGEWTHLTLIVARQHYKTMINKIAWYNTCTTFNVVQVWSITTSIERLVEKKMKGKWYTSRFYHELVLMQILAPYVVINPAGCQCCSESNGSTQNHLPYIITAKL